MSVEQKKSGEEQMIEILKSHGIEMKVGGCGCCGSPWITFKYKGETIVDDDDCGFDTEEVTPNAELSGATLADRPTQTPG